MLPALLVARLQDGVARAAELERPHRLQQLELQPDLDIALDVEPDERRAQRDPLQPFTRALDLVERDHREATVPTFSASARARMCSAATRSSIARPSDLKSVSSSSLRRPSAVPFTISPISARMCSGPTSPSRCGTRKSPASLSVDSRRSTNSAASRTVCESTS